MDASIKFFPEPKLEFRYGQTLEYPRDGLYLYGPVDSSATPSAVRYGVISTPEGAKHFAHWSKRISGYIDIPVPGPRSRKIEPQNVPFPGFEQTFGKHWPVVPTVVDDTVDPEALSRALRTGNRNENVKAAVDLYYNRLQAAIDREEAPVDFWFVVIPEEVYLLGRPLSTVPKGERIGGGTTVSKSRAARLRVEPTLFGIEDIEALVYDFFPHFRRQLKARLLPHRVVTQLVRETTLNPGAFVKSDGRPLRAMEDEATIAWKLTTACYYKSGGRPWQLANVRDGVCYVGLVYKQDERERHRQYAVCAAQMFLANGEGIVFRGALGPWYQSENREFHLDQKTAAQLMRMVVAEYKQIHGGTSPKEVFIHASAMFSNDEWDGFLSACPGETNLVGIQISDPTDGLKLYRPGEYPVIRGTTLLVDDRTAYVWTAGYSARLDTYMGPETPNPILVKVVRGTIPLDVVIEDVLGLTKINFNSCLMSDRMPVTIKFANAIGEVLVAAPSQGEPKLPFKYYI